MTTRKRWAGLLAAGTLTFTLAACSGDSTGSGAGSDDSGSTDGTTQSAPAEAGQDGAAAADAAPGDEVSTDDFIALLKSPGEEKLSSYTMSMDMKSGGEGMTMKGAVDMSGESPKMDMDMTIPGAGEMKMIMADGRVFMQMPGVTEEGKFMEVPKEQLGDTATALEEVDLTRQFDEWEKSAKKVVFVGEEDVDGTTMRHYEVTMDGSAIADAAASLGADDAAATSAATGDFTYDVWLDDENLMRKVVFELEGLVTEMTADDWGKAQKVEAPADDALMTGGPNG